MQKHSTNTRPDNGRITVPLVIDGVPVSLPPYWSPFGPEGQSDEGGSWPGIDLEARWYPRPRSQPRPLAPYEEEEVQLMSRWAEGGIGETGAALMALLALIRGAGLDLPAVRALKGRHVYHWGDFLAVRDPATMAHPVAVDWDWARIVEKLAEKVGPNGYLVRPSYAHRTSRHFISDIVHANEPWPDDVPRLDCRRLRTTWIVHTFAVAPMPACF